MKRTTNYSPSTPPSSTSTRDTATLDGSTIKILLALAGYLDSVGQALSDVPGHLRWLADGTDLVRLLGLEQPSPPVDCSPSQGPVVGRSVAEIRADLVHRRVLAAQPGYTPELDDVDDRLALDVEPLLSEVEAAHRFEQSAAAERDALLAEVDRLERLVETMVVAANANAAAVHAVDALVEQARKVSPSGSMTVYVGDLEVALGRRAESVRGIVGADQ